MRAYADRVRFQIGDATRLPFADGAFDGVISYGSIKHWTSRDAGLAECVRVLKPGGPLLITDANRSAAFEDAESFIAMYPTPRFLRGPNLAIFRTWIAGRSIDLDDARALADRINLVDKDVSRIANAPILMISGRRAPVTAVTQRQRIMHRANNFSGHGRDFSRPVPAARSARPASRPPRLTTPPLSGLLRAGNAVVTGPR